MHRKDAIAWVVTVCASVLRLSQAKTLGILVGAAMRVERINLFLCTKKGLTHL